MFNNHKLRMTDGVETLKMQNICVFAWMTNVKVILNNLRNSYCTMSTSITVAYIGISKVTQA